MQGKTEQFLFGRLKGYVYLPPGCGRPGREFPVVFVNGGEGVKEGLEEMMGVLEPGFGKSCEPFLLVGVTPEDWNRDFTPWEAPALQAGQPPFGGRAEEYLGSLTQGLLPELEKRYPIRKGESALLGYSLGGLASLYALYCTDVFRRIASVSGSLWFDGWTGYMKTHEPKQKNARVYLSLGSAEGKTKHPRMAAVSACTEEAKQLLERQLPDGRVLFEQNRGGHFSGVLQRHIRALNWLMKKE